jgi:hypothetical protein
MDYLLYRVPLAMASPNDRRFMQTEGRADAACTVPSRPSAAPRPTPEEPWLKDIRHGMIADIICQVWRPCLACVCQVAERY